MQLQKILYPCLFGNLESGEKTSLRAFEHLVRFIEFKRPVFVLLLGNAYTQWANDDYRESERQRKKSLPRFSVGR